MQCTMYAKAFVGALFFHSADEPYISCLCKELSCDGEGVCAMRRTPGRWEMGDERGICGAPICL